MKFIDRNTNPSRLDDDIRPLIDSILHNRRLFEADADDPPFVTEAVKYRREPQIRRQTSPYEGDDEFVSDIIEFFDFDPLDFQVDSWKTVDELAEKLDTVNEKQAAIFSAPTGFGKTEAFLGPLYQLLREGRQDKTAVVYPSRALLQDQLGRVLEHVHEINKEDDENISVGVYIGGMPWEISDVSTNDVFFDNDVGRPRFKLANCWCGAEGSPNAFEAHGTRRGYTLQCEANPEEHSFNDKELVLSRKDMVHSDNQPDILLTTLESLEGFSIKPNYDLIDNIETIVLDEVHLYTQMRGAHASKIIQNINHVTDHPILWLGSSATINNAKRFGKRLFGISGEDIPLIRPGESDINRDHNDEEHYYFMLTARDGPGASSTSIQQHLLFGHSLLQPQSGDRKKMLSFIDGISQVNQMHTQLQDADHTNELWQYHIGTDVEDWTATADKLGYEFLNEHLIFLPVYSDMGFDSRQVKNTDVLLSTSFLEVGIDVGEINTIMQYRTPWNLSSFKQRAGRAARKEGMDAHIAVTLSGLTNDSNMFYRASRFLDSDIRTPLKTDNSVVEWIHNRFQEYYDVATSIRQRNLRLEDPDELFIEEFLGEELGYDTYQQLILSPNEFFESELDIEFSPEKLFSEPLIDEARETIDTYLDDLHSEFEEIESFFNLDEGNVVRGEGAVDTYIRRVQDKVLELINSLSGQVKGYENKLEDYDNQSNEAQINQLHSELGELRTSASSPPGDTPAVQVQHYESLLGEILGLSGDLMQLRTKVNQVADNPIPQVRIDKLGDVKEKVNQLSNLADDDTIQEYYQQQKQAHYINECLNELEKYIDYRSPYLSLYAVKHLLRGAYYLERYLQIQDRTLGEVWYVPPNYYGDSGRYFTLFQPESTSSTDESIDSILNTYTPYRSEYQSDSSKVHAFYPHTEVTEDGVVFNFSEYVSGEVQDGLLVPESIELSAAHDHSEGAARNIVRYCPECYQIISTDQCLRHGKDELGKIHATPQVSTKINERTITDTTGSLSIADVTAEAALEGVTLEIQPARYWGAAANFDSRDKVEAEIDSPDEKLGFRLNTRGLVFDMSSYIDRISDDDVKSIVERYKSFEDVEYEYVAYHTAAHFFLQLVSDVSAVNTSMLLYGFDREKQEVYVFERTEGGQGIVGLVYEELASDPATVLEAIIRTGYNSQVINERLWAKESFVNQLPTDPEAEEKIESVVTEAVDSPFESVTERVTQEVFSSVDKADQFATDEDITIEEAYKIKHTIATEQIRGTEEFPNEAVSTLVSKEGIDFTEAERAENVFYSPDIDGCVENLHIAECIAATSQSSSLSYVLLEALREELLYISPSTETIDEMFDRELLPGGEFDDTSVFLNL